MISQCVGGILGTVLAHLMFDLAPLAVGTTARSGAGQWLGEFVATLTLVVTILGGVRYAPQAVPWLVGLTITAAYWFTSSTSFANPAVTVGRVFSDTFAGIAPGSVPGYVVAQLVGGLVAVVLVRWLYPHIGKSADDVVIPHGHHLDHEADPTSRRTR